MKTTESFMPDFCSITTALVLVLASLLLAFVLALADFSTRYDFLTDLGLRALFIVWITLPTAVLLCALRNWLGRLGAVRAGGAVLTVALAVTALVVGLSHAGLAYLGYQEMRGRQGLGFDLRILAICALVTLAWLRYQYVQARWQAQARAEALARMDALQARIRPHFLFNSLNTVASLIRKDPPTAEELLLDLAEVFRATLKQAAKLVPLDEEIALTRQYLGIEQQRLGARLRVLWKLEAPGDARIPPLSLQPLVENAIRYGIEPALGGGEVVIESRLGRELLTLSVLNTLPEAGARRAPPGNGMAVENLRARLEGCFQDQARLRAELADGRYQVLIVIPYQKALHENPHR